jgi:hypothetical protein
MDLSLNCVTNDSHVIYRLLLMYDILILLGNLLHLLSQYSQADQTKDKKGGARSTHGSNEKCIQHFEMCTRG